MGRKSQREESHGEKNLEELPSVDVVSLSSETETDFGFAFSSPRSSAHSHSAPRPVRLDILLVMT